MGPNESSNDDGDEDDEKKPSVFGHAPGVKVTGLAKVVKKQEK